MLRPYILITALLSLSVFNNGCKDEAVETATTHLASQEARKSPVLIEIFALTSCTPCADGHKMAQSLVDDPDFDVVILHHYGIAAVANGEVHPDFLHDQYFELHDRFKVDFYPSALVNRRNYAAMEPPKMEKGNVLDRYSWGWAYHKNKSISPANLGLEIKRSSPDTYNLRYEYYCTDQLNEDYRIHIALGESGIQAYMRGQGSTFIHDFVCRDFLSPSGGIPISDRIQKGKFYEMSETFSIPVRYGGAQGTVPNTGKMYAVVFLCNGQGEVVSSAQIPIPT